MISAEQQYFEDKTRILRSASRPSYGAINTLQKEEIAFIKEMLSKHVHNHAVALVCEFYQKDQTDAYSTIRAEWESEHAKTNQWKSIMCYLIFQNHQLMNEHVDFANFMSISRDETILLTNEFDFLQA